MTCSICKGTGYVSIKNGGIGLRNGVWYTYAERRLCKCRQGALREMEEIREDPEGVSEVVEGKK